MRSRRGVTLIEMLVATAVFMIGFTAAYSLFLFGMRNRALSDATVRGTLVATSQIAAMRLFATHEPATSATISVPYTPRTFVGDGDPRNGNELAGGGIYDLSNRFFAHPDQPSTYYRVVEATDLGDDPIALDAVGYRVVLVVGTVGRVGDEQTLLELCDRFRIDTTAGGEAALQALLERGSFQRFDAILHRRKVR